MIRWGKVIDFIAILVGLIILVPLFWVTVWLIVSVVLMIPFRITFELLGILTPWTFSEEWWSYPARIIAGVMVLKWAVEWAFGWEFWVEFG